MLPLLRKTTFAFPFACLVAVAVHFARFGDDHAFGGEANGGLVLAATGGCIAVALAILHAFLTAGTTVITGSLAHVRARALLPHAGALFALAAAIYYGIEALEGNAVELGVPTLLLAAGAAFVAWAARVLAAQLVRFVVEIVRERVALLDARRRMVLHVRRQAQPVHAEPFLAARRFGRAPPVFRTL